MRGRKPIPAAVKRLRGTPVNEPLVLASAMPDAPWKLDAASQHEWDRLSRLFHDAGLLTQIDGDALALYAETLARYRAANAILMKTGPLVLDEHGAPRVNPAQRIVRDCIATMQKFQAEFGATPSARMRVKGTPAAERLDPFDAFMKGKPALEGGTL